MKTKKKFLMIIFAFIMISIFIKPNQVNSAALQSNGDTPATKNLSDWMLQIRQMQELGGTLGRTDSINTNNLLSNATDLDIHMEKNTEYGAMAILSASAYGKSNKINDGETTTGNSTGVVIHLNDNGEKVAVGCLTSVPIFTNANSRYKNYYANAEYVKKSGDAIKETETWHGSNMYMWLHNTTVSGLLRGGDSIFSYRGNGWRNGINDIHGFWGDWYIENTTRAAIVVGSGL